MYPVTFSRSTLRLLSLPRGPSDIELKLNFTFGDTRSRKGERVNGKEPRGEPVCPQPFTTFLIPSLLPSLTCLQTWSFCLPPFSILSVSPHYLGEKKNIAKQKLASLPSNSTYYSHRASWTMARRKGVKITGSALTQQRRPDIRTPPSQAAPENRQRKNKPLLLLTMSPHQSCCKQHWSQNTQSSSEPCQDELYSLAGFEVDSDIVNNKR